MDELRKIENKIKQDPSQMHVDNDGFIIISRALDMALELPVEETMGCVNIAKKVFEHNKLLPNMPSFLPNYFSLV